MTRFSSPGRSFFRHQSLWTIRPCSGPRERRIYTQHLRLRGVTQVQVEYDGADGEGEVFPPRLTDAAGREVLAHASPEILRGVRDHCWGLLEWRHPTWKERHGSFGCFTWNMLQDELTHVHHARRIEYVTQCHPDDGQ